MNRKSSDRNGSDGNDSDDGKMKSASYLNYHSGMCVKPLLKQS